MTGGGAQSILSRRTGSQHHREHFDRDGAVVRFQWTVSEAPTATPVDTSDSAQLLSRAAVRSRCLLAFGVYSTPFSRSFSDALAEPSTIAPDAGDRFGRRWPLTRRITQTPPTSRFAMLAWPPSRSCRDRGSGLRTYRLALVGSLAGLAVLVCIVLVDGRRSAILLRWSRTP